MNLALDSLAQIIHDHFQCYSRDITRFASTAYSFEDWLNWEIFRAFISRGLECSPKPSYKKHFTQYDTKSSLGDLLVITEDGKSWLIETALVHHYTQDKWQKKIENDRSKLLSAKGIGVNKAQLIVLCSHCEQHLQNEWAYWFDQIKGWKAPDAQRTLSDGEQGEVCMLLWQVD